jgi:hypothetical protein
MRLPDPDDRIRLDKPCPHELAKLSLMMFSLSVVIKASDCTAEEVQDFDEALVEELQDQLDSTIASALAHVQSLAEKLGRKAGQKIRARRG